MQGQNVRLEEISKSYGSTIAANSVSLDIPAGQLVSLLGPSGSGKTTLLMMLAGFENPTAGRIRLGDRDVTDVPPNRRNVGMVFQRYALFPHMTVAENIAFPLICRKVPKAMRVERVRKALDAVRLSGYEDRLPSALSGGQQQRVALARSIVFDAPVILMDEPLGALDRKLREQMQLEIKQLQERLGATVVLVTHDQEEALTMSDRVAVLDHGRLMQFDTPRALYDRPNSLFVADFLGAMNFLEGVVVAEGPNDLRVQVGSTIVAASKSDRTAFRAGSSVKLAIRPSAVKLSRSSSGGGGLAAKVEQIVFSGSALAAMVSTDDGQTLRVEVEARGPNGDIALGERVSLHWDGDDALLFEKKSQ